MFVLGWSLTKVSFICSPQGLRRRVSVLGRVPVSLALLVTPSMWVILTSAPYRFLKQSPFSLKLSLWLHETAQNDLLLFSLLSKQLHYICIELSISSLLFIVQIHAYTQNQYKYYLQERHYYRGSTAAMNPTCIWSSVYGVFFHFWFI